MISVSSAVQGYLKAVGIDAEIDATQADGGTKLADGGTWDGLIFGTAIGRSGCTGAYGCEDVGFANWYKSTDFPPDFVNAVQVRDSRA